MQRIARTKASGPAAVIASHWPLYCYEAAELAIFMISACFFTVWLFDPHYPALHWMPSDALRRLLMGIAMGATAILIIHSPMGKRSGAHFNPAITLTYFRLGKIGSGTRCSTCYFNSSGGVPGVGVRGLLPWQHASRIRPWTTPSPSPENTEPPQLSVPSFSWRRC